MRASDPACLTLPSPAHARDLDLIQLLLPSGGIVALFRNLFGANGRFCQSSKSFFPIHRALQVLGLILQIVGFIIIVAAVESEYGAYAKARGKTVTEYQLGLSLSKYTKSFNEHVQLGFIIFILSLIQGILGWLAHVFKDRWAATKSADQQWARPVIPSWIHVYLGWILIILAWVQVGCCC